MNLLFCLLVLFSYQQPEVMVHDSALIGEWEWIRTKYYYMGSEPYEINPQTNKCTHIVKFSNDGYVYIYRNDTFVYRGLYTISKSLLDGSMFLNTIKVLGTWYFLIPYAPYSIRNNFLMIDGAANDQFGDSYLKKINR